MKTDLQKAIDLRDNGGYALAVFKDGELLFKSTSSGIYPLYKAYTDGVDFTGASAADKVVGKGAANFFKKLNVKELHTNIISKSAYEYLQSGNAVLSYENLVDFIINRTKDGKCPVETMAERSDDFEAFLLDVEQFLKRLEII